MGSQRVVECIELSILLLLVLNELLHLLLIFESQYAIPLLILLNRRLIIELDVLLLLLTLHHNILSHIMVHHLTTQLLIMLIICGVKFIIISSYHPSIIFGGFIEVVLDCCLVTLNNFSILLHIWIPCYQGIDAFLRWHGLVHQLLRGDIYLTFRFMLIFPGFYLSLKLVSFFKAQHFQDLLLEFWSRAKKHVLHAHVKLL